MPTSAEKYDALRRSVSGWDPGALEAELAALRARVHREFLEPAAARADDTALAELGFQLENVLLADLERGREASLADHTLEFAASQFLVYRSLRARFAREGRGTQFALMFNRLGFATAAALLVAPPPMTRWMAQVFVEHYEADYECPHSGAPHFQAAIYRLCVRHLGRAHLHARSADLGLYSELFASEAIAGPGSWLPSLAEARLDASYRALVLEHPEAEEFGQTPFDALFPYEILAGLKSRNLDLGVCAGMHALLEPFRGVPFASAAAPRYFAACEARIREIEMASGVEGPAAAPR